MTNNFELHKLMFTMHEVFVYLSMEDGAPGEGYVEELVEVISYLADSYPGAAMSPWPVLESLKAMARKGEYDPMARVRFIDWAAHVTGDYKLLRPQTISAIYDLHALLARLKLTGMAGAQTRIPEFMIGMRKVGEETGCAKDITHLADALRGISDDKFDPAVMDLFCNWVVMLTEDKNMERMERGTGE